MAGGGIEPPTHFRLALIATGLEGNSSLVMRIR